MAKYALWADYDKRVDQTYQVIVEADAQQDGTRITFACGHKTIFAPHFHVKVGTFSKCWDCEQLKQQAAQ